MKTKLGNHCFSITKTIFILILICSVFVACQKDKDLGTDQNQHEYLVKYNLLATVNKSTILLLAIQYPQIYEVVSKRELSDVKVYKIIYKTLNAEGEEMEASGAVVIPMNKSDLPVLSYQHGTLFTQSDAPSNYSTGIEIRGLATIFASTGYAVSVPDYLGYGISSDYPHPYEHSKTLGSASFDMLMAAKELFSELKISTTDKLFLAGYSEGGGATMALHKYIEENSDLVVTMSAPASGAYNKTAFAKDIMMRDENLNFLPRFMWVIESYNWIYNINRPWNSYTNEPYATKLEEVAEPAKLADVTIDKNPQNLFTSQFRTNVLNGSDPQFMHSLADNDIFNWTPKYPITLYYGTADDYVFPLNSETAYDALKANGATVTKVAYPGLDHNTALIPYLLDIFTLFDSLK